MLKEGASSTRTTRACEAPKSKRVQTNTSKEHLIEISAPIPSHNLACFVLVTHSHNVHLKSLKLDQGPQGCISSRARARVI